MEYEEFEGYVKIVLEAANGAIIPWVEKVSINFPDLTFRLERDGYIGGVHKPLFIDRQHYLFLGFYGY